MTDTLQALAQASGEAMTNAAKHSGADKVSVYVEVGTDAADVYIGDGGIGFDPEAIDVAHRGIAHSIVGRMQLHGGEATIESAPGQGTEVHLRMPRR